MRICIYGAGSIGGFLAARLAAAGADVSVVVRGAHLAAIRARGLILRDRTGERSFAMPASDDPRDLGPQDLVICAAKAHSLTTIAPAMAPLLGPDTPVVFCLNGIPWWYFHGHGGPHEGRRLERLDPGGVIWDTLGPARALGCVVRMGASVPEPGVIDHAQGDGFAIGEPDGSLSPRLERIVGALAAAGVSARATPRIRDEVWMKLQGNAASNPVQALTRGNNAQAAEDPEVRRVVLAIMREVAAVGSAFGARFDRTPEERLALAGSLGSFRSSTLQDLEAGRPMEVEPLTGAVRELGELAGVPTPTFDIIYALLRQLAMVHGLYPGPA